MSEASFTKDSRRPRADCLQAKKCQTNPRVGQFQRHECWTAGLFFEVAKGFGELLAVWSRTFCYSAVGTVVLCSREEAQNRNSNEGTLSRSRLVVAWDIGDIVGSGVTNS